MLSLIFSTLLVALGTLVLVIKIYFPWVVYDISFFRILVKVSSKVKKRQKRNEMMIDLFEQSVKRNPEKTFFIFEGEKYSYGYAEVEASRVSRGVMKLGVKCGDTVSILFANEPRFIWMYLGLLKVGVSITLINTSLKGKQLLHHLQTGRSKLLVIGSEFVEAVKSVSPDLGDTPIYTYGDDCPPKFFLSFNDILASTSTLPVDPSVRASVKFTDVAVHIFTSGTTGLPKAAILTQRKIMSTAHAMSFSGMNSDDILYVTLPLYHTSALVIGLGNVCELGAPMVLRRKFSASAFWDECRSHGVTVVLYIGELCRYLINSPRKPCDRQHKVHTFFGNGLRMDIWQEFVERFNIPRVAEFYGSTEGSSSMINLANKVGAVGRMSPITQKFAPQVLVEYVTDSTLPVRDEHGRCIPIRPGSSGLLLSPVSPQFPYSGYLGPKTLSERTLIRDVRVPGDVYLNTGDVLYLDHEYFVYFRDRLGDTFRWKGENVSTTEVANVLTETKFISDANVYGVKIPGQEGRAGMAAIVANDGRPLTEGQRSTVYQLCKDSLASYSRPRFLRVVKHGELTVTFKQKKQNLVEEGFDITIIKDPMYFLDQDNSSYVPLDENMYVRVINGGVRV